MCRLYTLLVDFLTLCLLRTGGVHCKAFQECLQKVLTTFSAFSYTRVTYCFIPTRSVYKKYFRKHNYEKDLTILSEFYLTILCVFLCFILMRNFVCLAAGPHQRWSNDLAPKNKMIHHPKIRWFITQKWFITVRSDCAPWIMSLFLWVQCKDLINWKYFFSEFSKPE